MIIPQKRRYAAPGAWTPPDAATAPNWWLLEDGIIDVAGSAQGWENAAGANDMTYSVAAIAETELGRKVVRFQDAGVFTGVNTFGANSITDFDVYCLLKRQSAKGFYLSLNGTGDGASRTAGYLPHTDNVCYFDAGGSGGTSRVSANISATWAVGDWAILNIRLGASIQELYLNGVLIASDTSGHNCSVLGGLRIGQYVIYNSAASIAQLVAFPQRLSAADREKMEGYMAHYLGIEAELEVTHPYRYIAPTA